MSTVAASERGVLRVFAVDLPEAEIGAFLAFDRASGFSAPFAHALVPGLTLDPDFIAVFPVRHLPTLGHKDLLDYVSQTAFKPADLAHNAKALRAEAGWVVLIWSDAFGDRAATLTPAPPIRPVATLRMTDPAPRDRSTTRVWVVPKRNARMAAPPGTQVRRRNAATGLALITMVLLAFALVYIGVPQ